jgi:carbon storage regulator
MLVLTRKKGEAVVLPDQGVVFTILEIQGNKVRVGIAAPQHVEIHRREVWVRMQTQEAEMPASSTAACR